MTEDMYLSLAIELFEKGTWSKDEFIKKIILYAKDKNMDMAIIDEIIDRLTKTKEYTVDEKKKFLSVLTILGDELKYGEAALEMSDEMVEKFYEMEKQTLDEEKFEYFHNLANSKGKLNDNDEKNKDEDVVENNNEENEIKKVWNIENEEFVPVFSNGMEVEEIDDENILYKSINDIIIGNFTSKDLLGNSDVEKKAIFNYLVENVKVEDLRDVANSLMSKMEPSYCLNFTIEWEKMHKQELNEINNEEVVENKNDVNDTPKVDETTSNWMDAVVDAFHEPESLVDNNESSKIVVPKISFDSHDKDDMPKSEEEYKSQAENITKKEQDSSVKEVAVSNERLENLKKSKGKVINYFLKTAIVVASVTLLTPVSSITLVGGYLAFATMIKKGNFNPENPVGKAIKSVVEKVMYIGMNKEEIENERGKSR